MIGSKICGKNGSPIGCQKEKDISEFYYYEKTGTYSPYCNECRLKYQTNWKKNNSGILKGIKEQYKPKKTEKKQYKSRSEFLGCNNLGDEILKRKLKEIEEKQQRQKEKAKKQALLKDKTTLSSTEFKNLFGRIINKIKTKAIEKFTIKVYQKEIAVLLSKDKYDELISQKETPNTLKQIEFSIERLKEKTKEKEVKKEESQEQKEIISEYLIKELITSSNNIELKINKKGELFIKKINKTKTTKEKNEKIISKKEEKINLFKKLKQIIKEKTNNLFGKKISKLKIIDKKELLKKGYKICSNPTCKHKGTLLPISNFYTDNQKSDKLSSQCKECKDKIKKMSKEEYIKIREQDKKEEEIKKELFLKGYKVCSNKNCIQKGKPQPISNFHTENKKKFKLSFFCKNCKYLYDKKRREKIKSENLKRKKKIEEKKCNKCGKIKKIENFTKSVTSKKGYLGICKQCKKTARN